MRVMVALLVVLVAGCSRAQPPALDPCGSTPAQAVPTGRADVIVWGDSIATGGWPQQLGWQADARGCRTLHADRDAPGRLMANGSPAVWVALGTNDYYLSRWTPEDFGAAYGAALDELRTRKVYAQTPLARASEPQNRLGATLDQYRAAILVECGRRAWVTCVDGRSLVPVSRMPDGVHPDGEGQRVYAGAVRGITNQGIPQLAE